MIGYIKTVKNYLKVSASHIFLNRWYLMSTSNLINMNCPSDSKAMAYLNSLKKKSDGFIAIQLEKFAFWIAIIKDR